MTFNRITTLFLAVFAVAAFVLPASAQDAAAIEAAKRLIKVTDLETTLNESYVTGLDAQTAQFKQMGISDAGIAELKAEMLKFCKEIMPWKDLEPEFIRIYSEAFTAAELDELTAFHQTPIGKKSLKVMPGLMAEGMKLGQTKVQENMGLLQQRITPIIQKHMGGGI
jgi:hypothetical protein